MSYQIIHGVDLVNVHLMAFKVSEGDRGFFEKLFTPTEISYCQKKEGETNQALSFSARLAAKGAVGKILGANYEMAGFQDIEVINDDVGKPEIRLHNKARELALEIGINQEDIVLSLSHTDEVAIASAVAIIQKKKGVLKMKKERETEKTKRVKVVDEAAAQDAKEAAERHTIHGLFQAIAKEAGLLVEFQDETVGGSDPYSGHVSDPYGGGNDSYLVITMREDISPGLTSGVPLSSGSVIARFADYKRTTLTLPRSIVIQFYDKYRDRLDSFTTAAEKVAEEFGVDIEIRVVKEFSPLQ